MEAEEKIDKILKEIEKISDHIMLMQAVLLELTKPSAEPRAKRSVRTMNVVLEGCEDQTIEPSGPSHYELETGTAGNDDANAPGKSRIARAKTGGRKKREGVSKKP